MPSEDIGDAKAVVVIFPPYLDIERRKRCGRWVEP